MNAENAPLLITGVGTGRARTDITEAILYSIRRHGAGRVVFLCSAKTWEETLPVILEQLAWPQDRYHVDVCENEDDVQGLFLRWNRQWNEWISDCPDRRVIVDFTSGTKPMSAAAVLLAAARGADTLSYVVGERDAGGRVERSTGVFSLCPDLIVAHRQLRLAAEHFNAGSYAAARDIAAGYQRIEMTPDDHLRSVALSLAMVAGAYEAWDRFDYKQAAHQFKQSVRYWDQWPWIEGPGRLADNMELVVRARDTAKPDQFDAPLAADLLANADRCLERSKCDDAVCRLYRACELLAQIRLLRQHDHKTGAIDPSRLPAGIRESYDERLRRDGGHKIKLAMAEAYGLLDELGDDLGKEFRRRYGTWEKRGELHALLEFRNQSLLAHGTVSVRQEKARNLREHVLKLAEVTDAEIVEKWYTKAQSVRFGSL
ncbi:MAG TPA: TIGR02710 family CRISPR-associated CARF protein [Phycisphaerae bacterium]|nr:TIGR02710 family CRISPR-associated CARF protein [Phycisphaerae bacterium]